MKVRLVKGERAQKQVVFHLRGEKLNSNDYIVAFMLGGILVMSALLLYLTVHLTAMLREINRKTTIINRDVSDLKARADRRFYTQ